jgi:hypothetical protein
MTSTHTRSRTAGSRPEPGSTTPAFTERRAPGRRLFRRTLGYVVTAASALALVGAASTIATAAPTTHPAAATKPAAAANPTGAYWTGTWATAPQSGGNSFSQQTIRQIVHTSISGTVARLQLSNAFGTAPLTISDVHVASAGSGSSIVAGTDHTVTFGGSTSTTIAAGGTGISDTINFAVSALSNIAISFYLPNATGASTYHQYAMSTSYVASGDVSGSASLSNPQTQNSYFFLSSLDVQNPNSQGSVVALGASITDGFASSGRQRPLDRHPGRPAERGRGHRRRAQRGHQRQPAAGRRRRAERDQPLRPRRARAARRPLGRSSPTTRSTTSVRPARSRPPRS